MLSTESLLTNFSKRYKTALFAIAVLISCAFLIITLQQQQQESYASIVNSAGEQRMLSQRIALLAQREPTEYHQQQLAKAAEKLLSNQDQLLKQLELFDQNAQQQIKQIYFADNQLQATLEAYANAALSLSRGTALSTSQSSLFTTDKTDQILTQLDQVVSVFEHAVILDKQQQNELIYITWIGSLLCLLGLAFALLKPTQSWLADTYSKLLTQRNRAS
ncbi:MAG: type IV pili methyl-accepting chemotaxis transducer N-terminal domain-containing protein, partial [Pseudoalteromonas spongiae]